MTPNEGTQRIQENGILNCFEGFRNETVGTVFKNLEMSHLNFHPKKMESNFENKRSSLRSQCCKMRLFD